MKKYKRLSEVRRRFGTGQIDTDFPIFFPKSKMGGDSHKEGNEAFDRGRYVPLNDRQIKKIIELIGKDDNRSAEKLKDFVIEHKGKIGLTLSWNGHAGIWPLFVAQDNYLFIGYFDFREYGYTHDEYDTPLLKEFQKVFKLVNK